MCVGGGMGRMAYNLGASPQKKAYLAYLPPSTNEFEQVTCHCLLSMRFYEPTIGTHTVLLRSSRLHNEANIPTGGIAQRKSACDNVTEWSWRERRREGGWEGESQNLCFHDNHTD